VKRERLVRLGLGLGHGVGKLVRIAQTGWRWGLSIAFRATGI
jgi:hypothetical protein